MHSNVKRTTTKNYFFENLLKQIIINLRKLNKVQHFQIET